MAWEEKKSADPKDDIDSLEDRRLSIEGRTALQVSLEKLAFECEGKDETEIMRKYIQLCPFVSPESPAAKAAMQGLESSTFFHKTRDVPTSGIEVKKQVKITASAKRVATPSDRKPSRQRLQLSGLTFRTILFDMPLLVIFLIHSCLQWADYVHQNYLYHQLNAMVFTDKRRQEEITYYTRRCDVADLTTDNGADLFLPLDATPEEAYEHQLLHGFTVFRQVLSSDSTAALRQHIMSRNRNLTEEESIYVIENDNRYSFGLGTEEPAVTKAMMEIATHPQLRPSLEKIMGPDPALIEMTAITSSYGAIDQYYHDDVIPTASAIRYGRTFGPSYSVFIVLQNTTVKMGATGACPGTHYCSDSGVEELCTKEGFQLVDPDSGYWVAGDALLMNMNSFHRGSAHTDPDGLDRVMLILTFSPKPLARAESRLMSQGITFSLRWDMWGNTLNDLAHADTTMVWPWTTLRALGLYKLPKAAWGIDYITGSSMRMSNQDYGFKPDEFPDFVESGGLKWVPKFLQGDVVNEDDSWYEYFQDTFFKCLDYSEKVRRYTVAGYVVLFIIAAMLRGRTKRFTTVRSAVLRLLSFWIMASLLHRVLQSLVDTSDWAKDIKAERRYTGVFKNQTAFGIGMPGRTTLPTRHDVLVENRYGSEHLALYEDFVNGHPGNRLFRKHVKGTASQFKQYPSFLRNATSSFILSTIQTNGGRFLYQGAEAAWHWLAEDAALDHVFRELATHSSSSTSFLMKSSRRVISNYMYGLHRSTVLAQKFAVPYQRELESKMLKMVAVHSNGRITPPKPSTVALSFQREKLTIQVPKAGRSTRSPFPPVNAPTERNEGDWIASGDVVEHYEDGFWYYSSVLSVSAHGKYKIWYPYTNEDGKGKTYTIRRYKPFESDEEAEHLKDDMYHHCLIKRVNSDGTYDIYLQKFDEYIEGVSPGSLRRFGKVGDGIEPVYKSAYNRKEADEGDITADTTHEGDIITATTTDEDDYYYYGAEDGESLN